MVEKLLENNRSRKKKGKSEKKSSDQAILLNILLYLPIEKEKAPERSKE